MPCPRPRAAGGRRTARRRLHRPGSGPHALTTDLDEPGRTGPAAFRHAGRTIARLTTGAAQAGPAPAARDLDALRAELDRDLAPAGLYAWFAAKGMELTAPLRSIAEVHYGPRRVLARVDVPAGGPLAAEVAALDAALQAMAVLTLADPEAPTGTFLPVSVDRAARWGDPARTAFVLLDGAEPGADGTRRGDAALLAADGRVLVRLDGIEYRTVTGNTHATGTVTAAGSPPIPRRYHRRVRSRTPLGTARGGRGGRRRGGAGGPARPRITATTSLSAVGIDSLLATAVAADLDERYGVPLSPTDVLDAADCRTLAAHVAELAPEGAFVRPEVAPVAEAAPRATDAAAGPVTGRAAHGADAARADAVRAAAAQAADPAALYGADPGEPSPPTTSP